MNASNRDNASYLMSISNKDNKYSYFSKFFNVVYAEMANTELAFFNYVNKLGFSVNASLTHFTVLTVIRFAMEQSLTEFHQ